MLTLSEIFLAFMKSKQDLYLFKVKAVCDYTNEREII